MDSSALANGAPDAPVVATIETVTAAVPTTANDKAKGKRTTLSLHEKYIVKTFCEQQLNECKSRSDFVPSHDTLRQEIAAKFGWEVGRSTLSKIMSMDWDQLQIQGHPNPTMKRKRKPLFPAFEDDLVKSVHAYMVHQESTVTQSGVDGATETSAGINKSGTATLTEAIILEEAQRLKQVHGIKDEELVLSVGWLARFKHRNGIRLRKATSTRADGLGGSMTDGASDPNDSDAIKRVRMSSQLEYQSPRGFQFQSAIATRSEMLHGVEQVLLAPSPFLAMNSNCSPPDATADTREDSLHTSVLESLPIEIRGFSCAHCEPTVPHDIASLHIVVAGFNCVRDAFVAAALVGEHGSVTCIETNSTAARTAEACIEPYTTKVLGYAAPNLTLIPGPSYSCTHLFNTRDLVVFNCSFRTTVHKTQLIETAFNLLREGGECRLTYVSSSRRLSTLPHNGTDSETVHNLASSSMYAEDFRRMCQHLGFLDPRCYRTDPCPPTQLADPQLDLSITTSRLFKLRLIEDRPEDYGERATFVQAEATETSYRLDTTFEFPLNQSVAIDGNTAQILRVSWLKTMFTVDGDRSTHRGRFQHQSL